MHFERVSFLQGLRYQYFAAPATPSHTSNSYPTTPVGAIGYVNTGTVIYNPLSSSDGSLASYYEWTTLDPCYGHSSVDKQYHYHAVKYSFSTIITSNLKQIQYFRSQGRAFQVPQLQAHAL